MIRVLQYIPAFSIGGIESQIMGIYENINKEQIQFDFLVERKIDSNIEKKIKELGGKIYILPKFTDLKRIPKYIKELKRILKSGKWQVLHCNSWQTRPLVLYFANKYKIPLRIVHAHAVDNNTPKHKKIIAMLSNYGIKKANFRIACSKEAGISTFKSNDFIVLNNGVCLEKFKFSKNLREKIRNENKVSNDTIININVGRLTYLKNQEFLIDIFNELKKINSKNMLWILGSGDYKEAIEKKIKDFHIEDSVKILENKEVSEYLSAADNFIFPSITEGLGIAYIEAQANNLNCFVSNGVPKIADCNRNIYRFSLCETPKQIAELINKKGNVRKYNDKKIDEIGSNLKKYDITNVSLTYQNILKTALKEYDGIN